MIRRYSRPRHFTPGCSSRPLPSRAPGPSYGLTTMPSPPAPVSASHQSVAAATAAASASSTTCRRVGVKKLGVGRAEPVGDAQVPAVVPVGVADTVAGQHRERRQRHPGQPVGRPHVRPVGLPVGGDVARPPQPPGPAARRPAARGPPRRPTATGRPAAPPAGGADTRRTARGSARRPSPTRAAARSRAAASRSPAPPRARPPSTACRTRPSSSPSQRRHRRTAARYGCISPRRPAPNGPSPSSRQTSTTAREPMCFSSQITRVDAGAAVVLERLLRVLQVSLHGGGRAGRHRRRQPHQPARVHREAAHHLQRRRRVLRRRPSACRSRSRCAGGR